jgi:O-antigen/teichoic acid export membrane protein
MVIATPLFLSTVGTEAFGLWLLMNSVVALGGLVGLGTAEATVRFVADARGRRNLALATDAVQHNLLIGMFGSGVLGLLLILASPVLAVTVFEAMGDRGEVVTALIVAATMLFVQQVSGIFAAAIKGFEDFRRAARIEVTVRACAVGSASIAAWETKHIGAALMIFLAVNVLGVAWRALAVTQLLGRLAWLPLWRPMLARESWRFSRWIWMNAIVASVIASFDKLLVGSMLGAAPLAHYGIALQLASLVLILPGTGLGFLVPVVRKKLSGGDDTRRLTRVALAANAAVTGTLAVLLLVSGRLVLDIWVGSAIADEIVNLFYLLLGAFAISSLAVAPQYLLVASGEARYCSLVFLAAAAIGSTATASMIPVLGLQGAAFARYAYSATSLLIYRGLFSPTASPRA